MLGGDESLSIWASTATWFTPAMLFFVMNLMIGTILIISNSNKRHNHGDSSSLIPRVSSLFERVRSIKFSSHTTTTYAAAADSEHPYPSKSKTADYGSSSRLAQSIHSSSESQRRSLSQSIPESSLLERVKSNISSFRNTFSAESEQLNSSAFKSGSLSTQSEKVDTEPDHHVIGSKSDKTGVTPAKKPLAEMKKSRSEMRIPSESEEEEDVDLRRPATARAFGGADEGVDAKADDFISRFKQQQKLQRLDSLLRFKEMLNRGT